MLCFASCYELGKTEPNNIVAPSSVLGRLVAHLGALSRPGLPHSRVSIHARPIHAGGPLMNEDDRQEILWRRIQASEAMMRKTQLWQVAN